MLHFLNPWYLFFDENAMWPQLVCAHFSVTDTGSLHPMAWLTPRGPEVFAQKTRQDKKDAVINIYASLGNNNASAPGQTFSCAKLHMRLSKTAKDRSPSWSCGSTALHLPAPNILHLRAADNEEQDTFRTCRTRDMLAQRFRWRREEHPLRAWASL